MRNEHAEKDAFGDDEAVVAFTDDGRLLAYDERFCALSGVPMDVLAAGSLDAVLCCLAESKSASSRALGETLSRPPPEASGVITTPCRVLRWIVTPLRHGGVRGAVWTIREATRNDAIVRALRDAESWLRMFTAHHDGVAIEVDGDGRVVGLWATEVPDFFGVPETELHGRTLAQALGEEGIELDRRVRAVLASDKPASFELAMTSLGRDRVLAVNVALLPKHGGEPTTATVLVRDVTQQAHLEAQLRQAERLASVGLLAAGVAHEINNPLGYVLLNLQRVRRGLADLGRADDGAPPSQAFSELDHSLEMMLEGVQRMQTIVRDLKQLARGDQDEPREHVDLHRVLRLALEMAAPELDPRARVVQELGPVPPILASKGRLAQVFLNLLLNAAQAIPEGRPETHEVRVVTATDERGRALVEVHDTGAGIPDHVVRHVFDPFFTTKTPGLGTGLGLAICQSITTSFGGTIAVESRVGQGSVFRVVLPAASSVGTARAAS